MGNIAAVFSAELEGIHARTIEVEVDLNVGLHAFNIVGLADKALNEAKERVNSALKNSGVKPPNRENRRITVNLAPADVPKTGGQYDLAIALGYLMATQQVPRFNVGDKVFLGELALDGRLRPVSGALNIAEMAARRNFKVLFLPEANANEASAIAGIKIVAAARLQDVIAVLTGEKPLIAHVFRRGRSTTEAHIDLSSIRGQHNAKRALTIAASGRHNLLFTGPPGVGKSMLAQALNGILPPLTSEESIEVTKIWSAAGVTLRGLLTTRPFRAPHHTASVAAIVGGGSTPRPGEISLAHNGALFLDEAPEFARPVLEALRGPLEHGSISIARAKGRLIFPARFSLIVAMNPCPCGFFEDPEEECRCGPYQAWRYQRKVSGPLLDRIDLQIRVPRLPLTSLRGKQTPQGSEGVRELVAATWAQQARRFKGCRKSLRANADMSAVEAEKFVKLSAAAERFLTGLNYRKISPRAYYRLLKVARTIADLEIKEEVGPSELAEAWSYRLAEVGT